MTKREDQAREYAAEQWKYVKVYGSQGDKLTDEERKALKEASEFYIGTRTGVALSGLLERLK